MALKSPVLDIQVSWSWLCDLGHLTCLLWESAFSSSCRMGVGGLDNPCDSYFASKRPWVWPYSKFLERKCVASLLRSWHIHWDSGQNWTGPVETGGDSGNIQGCLNTGSLVIFFGGRLPFLSVDWLLKWLVILSFCWGYPVPGEEGWWTNLTRRPRHLGASPTKMPQWGKEESLLKKFMHSYWKKGSVDVR